MLRTEEKEKAPRAVDALNYIFAITVIRCARKRQSGFYERRAVKSETAKYQGFTAAIIAV